MIALVDYGIGNLRSVQKALEYVGADVVLTDAPGLIRQAAKVVLPGVGAFGDGIKGLKTRGLEPVLRDVVQAGIPLLGICVGMQLLFEVSEEMGLHAGLGILPGKVKLFSGALFERQVDGEVESGSTLKVPQTGWNEIHVRTPSPLLEGLLPGSFAYFNHSYYCAAAPADTLAVTDYGFDYPSIVGRGRVYGIQFHPEKSQNVGLRLLRNFVELC
jgi:glutamine amidotransferase